MDIFLYKKGLSFFTEAFCCNAFMFHQHVDKAFLALEIFPYTRKVAGIRQSTSDETNDQFRCTWKCKTKANGDKNKNCDKNTKRIFDFFLQLR